MCTPKAAVTRLAARIKASVLANIDKLQRLSANRAKYQLAREIERKHTPGAFGNIDMRRYKGPGGGLWRRNAAHGKVRGY